MKVGADRTGVTGVTALPGVTLGLYAAQTGGTALFTCVSDVDGDCNFTVTGTRQAGGANRNRQFWVRQATTGVPAGWFVNQRSAPAIQRDDQHGDSLRFQTPALLGGQTYSST